MTTYPLNGQTLMSGFPYYDTELGKTVQPSPVSPQPASFDDRAPPLGHLKLPVRSADGSTITEWRPPQPAGDPTPPPETPLTRLGFRLLFTFAERMAIDNVVQGDMTNLEFAMLKTMLKDFDSAQDVLLSNTDTIMGVQFLEEIGLIGEGRAEEILGS